MSDSEKNIAEQRSDQAFSGGPFQDPRGAFRDRLRSFRDEQPTAFKSALDYFEKQLIPRIATGADPVSEWVAYGKRLGELTARGKTYAIDATGKARVVEDDFGANELLVHLPEDTSQPSLAIAVPREPSSAQRATYDLLINRARGLSTD